MKRNIRIMIIEDNAAYRESIETAINFADGMEMAGRNGSAEIALESLRQPGLQCKPDIILLDLHLPGMSGFEAIPWIRTYSPDAKIIVLTQSNNLDDVKKAISLDVSGYLLKSATYEQIIRGIRDVVKGGVSLDPEVGSYMLQAIRDNFPEAQFSNPLSEREEEILGLLAEGLVQKEIADGLAVSTSTVKTHISNLLIKLDAPNSAAAVHKAFRLGLFTFLMSYIRVHDFCLFH